MQNLLAHEGEREKHKEQAERLKAALAAWLTACRNPLLKGVKARPVLSSFLPPLGGPRPAGQPAKPARAGGRKAKKA